jgi:iron complex transport system ATP-binding protein
MSSGEARRVLIARALVHNPRALLFDEPCNSLDLAAQQSVRQTMRALANSGIGIVLVTHELGDIIPEIERVVLMSRGHIVADGRKDEILQNVERLAEGVWSSHRHSPSRRLLPDVVRLLAGLSYPR